jgi:hydrogenase maturation protease
MKQHVLILGIGNILWADEGFGVRAVEAINQQYQFPDNVSLMDGGTQGIYLVQHVQTTDILVVFDAIDYGLPPGSIKVIHDQDVPKFMGAKKMSLHQTGFQEVLAMAELMDGYPDHIVLIGVQPVELEDFGGSLRPQVKQQIQPAVDIAIDYLQAKGVDLELRQEPLPTDAQLAPAELDLSRYEQERPSETEAYRDGDPRVLLAKDIQFDPKPEQGVNLSVAVDHRRND